MNTIPEDRRGLKIQLTSYQWYNLLYLK